MDFSSILLFIFILIIQIHLNLSLWKKSSDSLEEYVIDVLFSNSLTIIRCNPYELQVFREISIETVGYIRCTNRNLFLPENHLESITLLQWNYTSVECQKNKKAIIEERTYLYVKHKAKHAFKKVDLNLIRVGSMGSSQSKMDEKNYLLSFKHPPRSLAMITLDQENENYTVDTFAFKHRPILCRERQLVLPGGPCTNQHLNLSYVCYYRIGVAEPPTVADLENELKSLSEEIDLEGNSPVDVYTNKRPKQKAKSIWPIIGIVALILGVITIMVVVIICCSCCQSKTKKHNPGLRHIDSDTSNISNIS